MAGLRSSSEGAGLEVRLLHAAALERTSPHTQRGHSAGPGHSTRGGTRTNRGCNHLPGRWSVRRPGRVASSTEPLPGRRLGGCLCAAHEPSRSSLLVPRRAALRRLAPRRRAAVGRRGRRLVADPGAARMRPDRLGGPRSGRAGGSASGSGRVPEAEQEGRSGPEVRAIRAAGIGGERDAADRRRRARQRLPDRPAAAQEAVLTKDRAADQALQALLPDREDPGGRGKCVRVGSRSRGRVFRPIATRPRRAAAPPVKKPPRLARRSRRSPRRRSISRRDLGGAWPHFVVFRVGRIAHRDASLATKPTFVEEHYARASR